MTPLGILSAISRSRTGISKPVFGSTYETICLAPISRCRDFATANTTTPETARMRVGDASWGAERRSTFPPPAIGTFPSFYLAVRCQPV